MRDSGIRMSGIEPGMRVLDIFDAVLAAGSIEYRPHRVRALGEMWRVLKLGVALSGGPTRPRVRLYRLLADTMMLSHSEAEARNMFSEGFRENIEVAFTGHRRNRGTAIVTKG